jgi:hypothetical protein
VLQDDGWWFGWVLYFIQKRTQGWCTRLKALENIALIVKSPVSRHAFDYHGIILLIAIDCC